MEYFQNEGIDTSHVTRAKNGECIGLTFTEILSKEQSSILMYRDNVADFCLAPEDIDEAYIASAKAIGAGQVSVQRGLLKGHDAGPEKQCAHYL